VRRAVVRVEGAVTADQARALAEDALRRAAAQVSDPGYGRIGTVRVRVVHDGAGDGVLAERTGRAIGATIADRAHRIGG
jgi:hypothetical protein